MWRVELHSHSSFSKDCIVSPKTILTLCQQRGIDRIAITDHDTAEGALAMHAAAPDRVIVGEEIMTTQGELLGYFMRETIPGGLTPDETIRRLRDQGAVISISHPFDHFRKGAWARDDLMAILPQVDAIEVFNARCLLPADNRKALAFAHEYGLCGTAGSDAHTAPEYGRAHLLMQLFDDASSFLDSLRTAQVIDHYSSPLVHLNSKLAKWGKKRGVYRHP